MSTLAGTLIGDQQGMVTEQLADDLVERTGG